jgi:hypothetical protein
VIVIKLETLLSCKLLLFYVYVCMFCLKILLVSPYCFDLHNDLIPRDNNTVVQLNTHAKSIIMKSKKAAATEHLNL